MTVLDTAPLIALKTNNKIILINYTHNGDLNTDPPDLLNRRTSPHSLAHHLMRSLGIHGSDIVFLLHKFLKHFKTILHLDIFV